MCAACKVSSVLSIEDIQSAHPLSILVYLLPGDVHHRIGVLDDCLGTVLDDCLGTVLDDCPGVAVATCTIIGGEAISSREDGCQI